MLSLLVDISEKPLHNGLNSKGLLPNSLKCLHLLVGFHPWGIEITEELKLEKMVEKTAANYLKSFIGGFIGYIGLKNYIKSRVAKLKGDTTSYLKEESFWRDVIGTTYTFNQPKSPTQLETKKIRKRGTLVKLKNFFITEWFPRCPGFYWTTEAHNLRQMAGKYRVSDYYESTSRFQKFYKYWKMDENVVLVPTGKMLMVLGGLGTTRLSTTVLDDESNEYKILCATSSGRCDRGIPILVRKQVYEGIENELKEAKVIQADIEGFFSEISMDWEEKTVLKTARRHETREWDEITNDWFKITKYIPNHCLKLQNKISSITNIEKVSGIKFQATAWTLFKQHETPYSFTYAVFNPRIEETIQKASQFINEYVDYYSSDGICLTEFDDEIRRLDNSPVFSLLDTLKRNNTFKKKVEDEINAFSLRWDHSSEGLKYGIMSTMDD